MRRILNTLFFTMLFLFGAVCTNAADMENCIIHKNSSFEDHKVGEVPSAFEYIIWKSDIKTEEKWINASRDNTEIVKLEKDGNAENLAVKLNSFADPDGEVVGFARCPFSYYPMKEKGVISFSFMVDDLTTKKISQINTNVSQTRHLDYLDSKAYFDFISIVGDKVYYRNTLIKSGIEKYKWYGVDFLADVKKGTGKLYLDGECFDVALPSGTVNICEVKFDLPTTEGTAWYIDDLRVYEADEIIDDTELDAAWNKYKSSPFYFGYEFENGRASNYNYMAFLKADGKRFTTIGTDRLYSNNSIVKLPAKIYKQDGHIMVPVRAIAEMFGAQVTWKEASRRVCISHNGKAIEAAPNENIYYINGTPSKLESPIVLNDGSTFIRLDILLHFLEKEYYMEDDIIWFDKPKSFDWSLPLTASGTQVQSADRWTLSFSLYERMLTALLFDRPTNEDIAEAIRTNSPDITHPRLQFTNESIAKIKEGMKTDEQLAASIASMISEGKKELKNQYVPKHSDDGKRASYTTGTYNSLSALATAYLFSESDEDKKLFKDAIWNTMEILNTFPDFHSKYNNGLGTGTMTYGLAFAYDWVDWTDEERKLIEDMCKRNIFDYALQNYNTSMTNHGRSIGYNRGNMSPIINGAYASLAISMFETDPEYFGAVIRGALYGMSAGYLTFFPRGEWEEGLSYWKFVCTYFPFALKGMQTALGTDFGCSEVPGVLDTYNFPIAIRGGKSAYGFGDGDEASGIVAVFMFCADQTGNKEIAQFRKQTVGTKANLMDIANWVFDTSDYNLGLDALDRDTYAESAFTVVMRTGWDAADTSVAFHGGANDDGHGHFDTGSVQFDMNGVRFGTDLIKEDYNLRSNGYYEPLEADKYYPNGYPLEKWHYYRQKGEGHNLVVANRSEANTIPAKVSKTLSADMKPDGSSEFITMEFGETSSYALLDVTDTNDIFESAVRGVKLDKIKSVIEIQDDIRASKVTDFMWSMHTQAEIEISEDGKTAVLTQNNQKIKAKIANDCDYRFEALPASIDETYGTINKPLIETPNTVYSKNDEHYLLYGYASDIKKDYRKLAVRTVTDEFKLSVTFEPYIEGDIFENKYVHWVKWENKGLKKQTLDTVTVDGEVLTELSPERYNYTIDVFSDKSEVPKITAMSANKDISVQLIEAQTVPGVTYAVLSEKGQTVGLYSFVISPLNDTTKFHNDKQLMMQSFYVSNEPQPENAAANLFDGDFGTKFATDEYGGNVMIDFGSIIEGNLKLNIACSSGDSRKEFFKIEYSEDGINWTEAFNGSNSGTTKGLEKFDIGNKARYVQVSFYGNEKSAWASVSEMFVSNE